MKKLIFAFILLAPITLFAQDGKHSISFAGNTVLAKCLAKKGVTFGTRQSNMAMLFLTR